MPMGALLKPYCAEPADNTVFAAASIAGELQDSQAFFKADGMEV
jgi:hypothetical protein